MSIKSLYELEQSFEKIKQLKITNFTLSRNPKHFKHFILLDDLYNKIEEFNLLEFTQITPKTISKVLDAIEKLHDACLNDIAEINPGYGKESSGSMMLESSFQTSKDLLDLLRDAKVHALRVLNSSERNVLSIIEELTCDSTDVEAGIKQKLNVLFKDASYWGSSKRPSAEILEMMIELSKLEFINASSISVALANELKVH